MKKQSWAVSSAVVLAALVTVTGCTNNKEAPAPTSLPPAESTPAPSSHDAAQEAREKLAIEVATVMSTWTPAKDFNQTASEKRAAKFMTKERAQKIMAPERPTTGAEWNDAAAINATSEPTITLNEHTHGGIEGKTVSVNARWQWIGDNNQTLAGSSTRTYYFTFTDTEPLKIRDYTYESN